MMMSSLLLAVAVAGAQVPTITLSEALRRAASTNPENELRVYEEQAARYQSHQARSWYLPTLSAEGALLWWDSPLEVDFGESLGLDGMGDLDVDEESCTSLEGFATLYPDMQGLVDMCYAMVGALGGMQAGLSEPMVLREQQTQNLKLTATQPITGLYAVNQGHQALRALEGAAAAESQAVRSRVALDVVDTYFTTLQTRAMVGVAQRAVEALQAHQERAEAFHEVGMLGQNELLQIQVALSNVRLDLRRAQLGEVLLARKLALLVGADEPALEPVDMDVAQLPPLQVGQGSVAARAPRHPSMQALSYQARAARHGANAAWAGIIPQVAGIGAYEHNWGVGELAAAESWYLGIGLQWDVWSWGRNWYAAKESVARARQAELGLDALRQGITLQAEAALMEAELARGAQEASLITVDQAAENLRIVTARFDAHTATATDLLEAETLYTKAQGDQVRATFDYLVALARGQDALGLPIAPMAGLVLP